jgi:hypothetical protein
MLVERSTTFKFDIGKLKDKAVKQEFSLVIASNMRNNIQSQAEDGGEFSSDLSGYE